METRNIKLKDKDLVINELKYKDLAKAAGLEKQEVSKHMIISSTGMSEEEYDEISIKDGIKIMKNINEINGLDDPDFQ